MPHSARNHGGAGATPAWVADAIFYQIFPDRFARSERAPKLSGLEPWGAPPTTYGFKGGDLDGVAQHLDHIEALGATALYFTPMFASTANHRYHTHDYFKIDPILGGDAAFRRLLDAAHGRGMRVVLDGVFNHASRGFYQFNHTLENGLASPYRDWFHFDDEALAQGRLDPYAKVPPRHHAPQSNDGMARFGYAAWWSIPALPKLNTSTPAVRDFIFDVAAYWIDQGIDGWRLDVPSEIDDDAFWREFRHRVKGRNPDAYIVGEIWGDARRWLAGDQFDGVTNYLHARAILGFAFGERLDRAALATSGYRDLTPLTGAQLAARLHELAALYSPAHHRAQMNVLGSHDTPRLAAIGGGDGDGVRLALTALFALPGAPCVYYGDEIGLAGGHDPDNRRGFPWPSANAPAAQAWDRDLLAHVGALARLRRATPALRSEALLAHPVGAQGLLLERGEGAERALVILNAGDTPLTTTLPDAGGGSWLPALGPQHLTVLPSALGGREVRIAPRRAVVLTRGGRSG